MSLYEKVKEDRKAAMLAKDEIKKTLLGCLIGDVDLAKSRPDAKDKTLDELTEAKITSFLKANKENQGYSASDELMAQYKTEQAILESYRPKQLSQDEITEIVKQNVGDKLSQRDLGKAMAYLKNNHAGQYDGSVAKAAITALIV